jgi:hypothetical protein
MSEIMPALLDAKNSIKTKIRLTSTINKKAEKTRRRRRKVP